MRARAATALARASRRAAVVGGRDDDDGANAARGAFLAAAAAAGLGGVIGPLLGGWLYDRFAAVGAFGISALLMAVGAGLIFWLVREPSR